MPLFRMLAVVLVAAVVAGAVAPVLAVYGGQKGEPHPVIRAATEDLERAKRRLEERAGHEFGGHRLKAIDAINVALQELKLAREFEPKDER